MIICCDMRAVCRHLENEVKIEFRLRKGLLASDVRKDLKLYLKNLIW
jgi:hypothetical protein